MPIEHKPPTNATVRTLYYEADSCGEPDCSEPLIRVDEATGTRTLNSTVCHIAARRENGPRWDSTMTEDENRSESNLILLCHRHSSEIDQHPLSFPPELLHDWKAKQKEERRNGWTLTNDEVTHLRQHWSVSILDSIVGSNLGGYGQGGPGGTAIGPGAIGGQGGRGGDVVTGSTTLSAGKYEVVVGRGGKPGRPGGQTRIVASAGEFSGVQGIWAEALLLCDHASIRDGLVFANGGAWHHFRLGGTPGVVHGHVAAVLRVHDSCEYPVEEELRFELVDAGGTPVLDVPIQVAFEDAPRSPRRHCLAHRFACEATGPGVWTAQLSLLGEELAVSEFEVLEPR